ncbi:MAG: hypothetical protein O2856_08090 [Planctomycetota bacterium]|nr:hypothetical protein [Planctomycetota bacterium]
MLSRRIALSAALGALALQSGIARAQFFGGGCAGCGGPSMSMAAPITAASCCTPIPQMQATCYQTVPVTTYAQVKQTVQVPHLETAMEERQVTVYKPVTTSREVDVATVSYQNVMENKVVNKDMGRWVTNYHPVAKSAPCQIDPRPGALGWMNRTAYSMRTAFVPNYTTSRQYVPSMMTCNVPTVRQVAVQGTKRVTVQETRMVAEVQKQQVAVQKMVMRAQEVTVMQPQTAYRTVPIGTSMAYGGYGGISQMAYGGIITQTASAAQSPDCTPTTQSVLRPAPDTVGGGAARSANRENFEADKPYDRDKPSTPASGASHETPARDDEEPIMFTPTTTRRESQKEVTPASHRRSTTAAADSNSESKPSGWRATRKSSERSISQSDLTKPSISMADSVRER